MGLYLGHTQINALNPQIVIQSGGTETKKDVNFIANGRIIKSYSLDEVQSITSLPEIPDQEYCTSDGWNHSIVQVRALKYGRDIGALYKSSDGNTKIFITISEKGRKNFRIHCKCTVANGAVISWGDGQTSNVTSTSYQDYQHEYSSSGDYVISISVVSGVLNLGRNSSGYNICGQSTMSTTNPTRGYSGCITKVILGNDITSLNQYCFQYCYSLRSIVIPDTVTTIGMYCFQYCYSLQHVVIPDSITMINTRCFDYCHSLKSMVLPESIDILGAFCFQNCYSIQSITIPDSIQSLGINCFSKCQTLQNVIIPDSVTELTQACFTNCYGIHNITLPNSIITLGQSSFSACNSLQSITVPDSVTELAEYSFQNCNSLQTITLPNTITSIGAYCFTNCYSLGSIDIPDSVLTIGSNCFQGCCTLREITIPDSVTTIDVQCFQDCTTIQSIKISESVTSLGQNSFNGCQSLKVTDFHTRTTVLPLASTNVYTNTPTDLEIVVPDSLYSEWIAATNWSDSSIKSRIVKYSESSIYEG